MRSFAALAAALLALALTGCLGGDSADDRERRSRSAGCPEGKEPRFTLYDRGENPKGEPTPLAAVDALLRQQGGDASSEDFESLDRPEGSRKAIFVQSDEEFELARLYVKEFDRGWIVISFESCKGAI